MKHLGVAAHSARHHKERGDKQTVPSVAQRFGIPPPDRPAFRHIVWKARFSQ
jgi:hypothetical protein